MAIIQFDIRYPNGQKESIVVEGERALIGSASFCDVRLPMDQAAYEHVLVEAIGATLRAEAKAEDPPATINGMPLNASPLGADAVLGIGRIRLFVSFVPDLVEGAAIATKSKKQSNPLVQLGLVAIFGMGAYILLSDNQAPITPAPEQPPKLFSSEPVSCPQSDPSQAAAFAQEELDLGDAKRERMPFAVREGLAAVGLYRTAAACFEKGGQAVLAKEAKDSAESLARDLSDDFRARELRLNHMLAVKDYQIAARDVAVLRAMTQDKTGNYVEWLARLAEQLKGRE